MPFSSSVRSRTASKGPLQTVAYGGGQSAEPQLSLDPTTLAVSVWPGDGETSVAFDVVQAAVDAVAQGKVTIAGQTGPTVAARFYAIAGTTLYEAWQLFDPARSSLEGPAVRRLEWLERSVGRLTTFLTQKRQEAFLDTLMAATDLRAGTITTASCAVVPINRDAVGRLINPAFIAQAERVIQASAALTEEQKFIAEIWEDGPGTPFPPGTWMIFGQYAAEHRNLSLGEEVKLYFTLGHALQSAAVATWREKFDTDVARPVRLIRDLSALGLLGDQDLITGQSTFDAYSRDTYQTETINGMAWETYQQPNGPYSPPFPEYVSGHSTFSAAAGTVLEHVLGANFGATVSGQGVFEPNHQRDVVTLRWNTWQEAYEQAGLSRIYGGIHFDDGNQQGLALGALIGEATFQAASQLWA